MYNQCNKINVTGVMSNCFSKFFLRELSKLFSTPILKGVFYIG